MDTTPKGSRVPKQTASPVALQNDLPLKSGAFFSLVKTREEGKMHPSLGITSGNQFTVGISEITIWTSPKGRQQKYHKRHVR